MPKNVTVDDSVFRKKINRLMNNINKPLIEELPLYTEWFTQSAVKATPPKRGAKRKRSVIELKTNRYTKRGKEKKRFKVPFRQNKNKGARYFDKKGKANKFAKIMYRFISKYGWLASAENVLKKKLNVKMPKVSPEVIGLKRKIGLGKKSFNTVNPFVLIINAVEYISKFATVAARTAMSKTERRIYASKNKKKVKKKYKKIWSK